MRRVAALMTVLLLATACTDDQDGSERGLSLDLDRAAVGAQQAIDQGDALGGCPWIQQAALAAIRLAIEVGPDASDVDMTVGQVFRGGEVDITYCESVVGPPSTPTGLEGFRIDVHPGTADLQQYLDEEWGVEPDEPTTGSLLGGTVMSWCFDEDRCIAAWQGDGLFVALVTDAAARASEDDAVAALTAALPIVVVGLVSD